MHISAKKKLQALVSSNVFSLKKEKRTNFGFECWLTLSMQLGTGKKVLGEVVGRSREGVGYQFEFVDNGVGIK